MTDQRRDISLFVSVARIEASLHSHRSVLQKIPAEIAAIDRALAEMDEREKVAAEALEDMARRRRNAERLLREHEDHLKKIRGQQSMIKNNDEYVAMLKEVAALEKSIADEEEEILVLMDRIEEGQKTADAAGAAMREERARRGAERAALEAKAKELSAEAERFTREKPKLLAEINPALLKKYERLAAHHRDVAVTRVEDEHCGACRQQVPPQLAVEVRKGEQFITCPACGRILVHYAD
jgi:hypothetical protein